MVKFEKNTFPEIELKTLQKDNDVDIVKQARFLVCLLCNFQKHNVNYNGKVLQIYFGLQIRVTAERFELCTMY